MPELPEVETITKQLQSLIIGKQIADLQILHPKSFIGDPQLIIGQKILAISRRAKLIKFILGNDLSLVTHLKMTGQLLYQGSISKHSRLLYQFSDQSQLVFNDQRLFGYIKLVTSDEWLVISKKLGPDINDPALTADYLFNKFKNRKVAIKQALMNNEIVCGLGNIYAAEALNLAKIGPFRPAQSLSLLEVAKVFQASQKIIGQAIVNASGQSGAYQKQSLVYGRLGQKCYNCGRKIKKKKLAGRGTYYCSHCQV